MTQTNYSQDSEEDNDSIKPRHPPSVPSDPLDPHPETTSDNDANEKPVREKLKKTSIASISKHAVKTQEILQMTDENDVIDLASVKLKSVIDHERSGTDDDATRGRAIKKRSFDNFETPEIEAPTDMIYEAASERVNGHARKRSREVRTRDPVKADRQPRALDTALKEEGEGTSFCISPSGS